MTFGENAELISAVVSAAADALHARLGSRFSNER